MRDGAKNRPLATARTSALLCSPYARGVEYEKDGDGTRAPRVTALQPPRPAGLWRYAGLVGQYAE
eukprot:3685951-Rhodomonas_salina.6